MNKNDPVIPEVEENEECMQDKKLRCSQCRNKDMATVPFFVYEGTAYRFERSQKALIIVTIIALILSLAIIIGAIFVVKMLGDVLAVKETKEVVQGIVDSARV